MKENIMPEVPWVTLSVDTEHRLLFEDFCKRNQIPYEVARASSDGVAFCVRDGIDAQDAVAYMLKKTLTPGDEETVCLIHMLFQRRLYWSPTYEYEFSVNRTKEDDSLLMRWDYPL